MQLAVDYSVAKTPPINATYLATYLASQATTRSVPFALIISILHSLKLGHNE